jgi:hypothetical protein
MSSEIMLIPLMAVKMMMVVMAVIMVIVEVCLLRMDTSARIPEQT